MGMRIQPHEIKVPEKDPFRDDLLNRKESVEILTELIANFEGPCVLALDAEWGNGKTTFLRMWSRHLRNLEFPVVEFNAWETDFAEQPFLALSGELTRGLKEYADESLEKKIERTKELTKELLVQAVPIGLRLASASLGVASLTNVGDIFESLVTEKLDAYSEAQNSIRKFRRTLHETAEDLWKKKEHPLVVMIDELDRCRPSYAVELLEVAKHLFSVDRIVYVLAVNRSELVHSIKALYGSEFGAQGYLGRFFDVDIRLPEPEREAFLEALLRAIDFDDYFKRTQDSEGRNDAQFARDVLNISFSSADVSFRRIAQAVYRLGLVLGSLRADQRSFAVTAVVALVLRTIDEELYRRFCRGEASDMEVVDKVFGHTAAAATLGNRDRCDFEATVAVAAMEVSGDFPLQLKQDPTPLLKRYFDVIEGKSGRRHYSDPSHKHASGVIEMTTNHWGIARRELGIGFKESVRRIELFSSGLMAGSK